MSRRWRPRGALDRDRHLLEEEQRLLMEVRGEFRRHVPGLYERNELLKGFLRMLQQVSTKEMVDRFTL